ncbi:MAG: hypothetical protein IJL87_10040 [Clostridia bacterium]|nr:hypothetical protein [Clostridia bacterium]
MQQQENNKLANFLHAINEYAERQSIEIEEETEQFMSRELKKAEDDANREAYYFIQHELSKMKNEISGDYSRKEMERRRQLLEKRAAITAEVFDRAKSRLLQYTKTENYGKKVTLNARKSAVMFGDYMGSAEFYIRPGDSVARDHLHAVFANNAVHETDDIKIGGFRAVNLNRSVVVDATLDTALDGQREWFLENSGLSISEV